MLCGSSFKNKGVQQLLDAVVDYLPYPGENGGIAMVDADGKVIGTQEVKDDAPARALAFKVINDQFGTLTFVRIYSGVIKKGDTLLERHPRQGKSASAASSRCRPTRHEGHRRSARGRHLRVRLDEGDRDRRLAVATRHSRRCSSACASRTP